MNKIELLTCYILTMLAIIAIILTSGKPITGETSLLTASLFNETE